MSCLDVELSLVFRPLGITPPAGLGSVKVMHVAPRRRVPKFRTFCEASPTKFFFGRQAKIIREKAELLKRFGRACWSIQSLSSYRPRGHSTVSGEEVSVFARRGFAECRDSSGRFPGGRVLPSFLPDPEG